MRMGGGERDYEGGTSDEGTLECDRWSASVIFGIFATSFALNVLLEYLETKGYLERRTEV